MLIIIIIIKSGAPSGVATPCCGAKTKTIKNKIKQKSNAPSSAATPGCGAAPAPQFT